jgi:hypothetical protein
MLNGRCDRPLFDTRHGCDRSLLDVLSPLDSLTARRRTSMMTAIISGCRDGSESQRRDSDG